MRVLRNSPLCPSPKHSLIVLPPTYVPVEQHLTVVSTYNSAPKWHPEKHPISPGACVILYSILSLSAGYKTAQVSYWYPFHAISSFMLRDASWTANSEPCYTQSSFCVERKEKETHALETFKHMETFVEPPAVQSTSQPSTDHRLQVDKRRLHQPFIAS